MELKVDTCLLLLLRWLRFNRTFMELKDAVEILFPALLTFQSHLYGIESDILRFAARSLGVSIAPLWN